MTTRMVEIEDSLQDNVDNAIEEVKEELLRYLECNPDIDELPCLHNDLNYSGAIHEIVDRCVPIYTKEIEDTWYLYSDKLKEAYDAAGCYDNPPENYEQVCIYFYIEQEISDWYYDNAQDIFDERCPSDEDE